MSVITRGAHPAAQWPGVRKFTLAQYSKHPMEYAKIFDMQTSGKAYEEDVETSGFGLAQVKAEGAPTQYDFHAQGFTKRYTHVAYSLGYVVTKEEIDDNQYESYAFKRSKHLALSFRTTKEIVAANILNRGFDPAYAGGDGQALFSAAHPVIDGGAQSNLLPVAADLSEASIEAMLIQIEQARNSRGHPVAVRGQKLVIAPSEVFNAERIIKSNLRSGTDFNDVNAMKSMGMLPGGICVNHYLTDPDAWFITTDAPDGLIGFDRQKFSFTKDNDFDTDNAKAKGYERYVFGWTDFRGAYGSPGA